MQPQLSEGWLDTQEFSQAAMSLVTLKTIPVMEGYSLVVLFAFSLCL
jgi:hypothetical protein